MGKRVFYILLVLMIASTSFFTVQNAFSQTSQTENKSDTGETPAMTANPSYTKGITTGRARALSGGVVGLIGLVIGLRAKRRSKKDASQGRNGAIVALVLGIAGIGLSVIHLATSAGAVFGSGSGKAGAIVALVPSSISIIQGWIVLRKKN